MKQKNNSSDVVTKGFFRTELGKRLDGLLQGIRQEIGFATETVIEKLEKRTQEINYKNLTRLDSISKQLEEMREEKVIGDYQSSRLKKQVDNHEKRIVKLEQVQQIV